MLGREEDVDALRLISIILMIRHGLMSRLRDVRPNSGAAKSPVRVLRPTYLIPTSNSVSFAKITVRLKLQFSRLSSDAFSSVPSILFRGSRSSKNCIFSYISHEPLSAVLNLS